ncbi:MAG: TlpA disulfide reductase family protein [Spirochaetales bacterium]
MKQKILSVTLILFLLASTACSKGNNYNDEYNEENMVTLTGETISIQERQDVFTNPVFGFGFVVPEPLMNLVMQGRFEPMALSATITVFMVYSETLFELMAAFDPSNSTIEEQNAIRDEIINYIFNAGALVRVPKGEDADSIFSSIGVEYFHREEIAATDTNTYYFAYNSDYSVLKFTENESDVLNTVIDEFKDFKKNIFVFEPEEQTSMQNSPAANISLASFETQTIDGETVTQAIFENYDITMLNIWATWCGPCIEEMPELAKLHREMLPSNANMITLVIDAPQSVEMAHEIINASAGEFTTLMPSESLLPLINTISAIPTTVFIDSKGTVVGSPVVGVPGQNAADAYLSMIQDLLANQ